MTVADIQRALVARGYSIEIDGGFGRKTIAAVKDFQKAHALTVDGIVGPKTIAALNAAGAATGAKPLTGDPTPPWVAEARRKIGLHEKGDNAALRAFLASDGHALGDPAKLPWCFAGDVEIMTEDGWQRFDRLSAARVWQVDAAGNASLAAYAPIEKDYDGEAFKISGQTLSAVCDVGHRWWGQWGRGKPSRFGTLDEMTTEGIRLAAVMSTSAGLALSVDEITLIAAFMSDGSIRKREQCLAFEVSRERKVLILGGLEPKHAYTQKRAYGPLTKTPLTVFTFDIPTCFGVAFSAYKVLSREFVNGLSASQARAFIAAYSQFDGNVRRKDGRITLYTSEATTRDDLITIATLAGYWPQAETGGKSDLSRKESWRVSMTPATLHKRLRKRDVTPVQFKGKMFCVSVPAGRIIVRGESLSPCVTGNCGDFIETCLALTLPTEPMIANPYWALGWLKFGVALDVSKPALGAVGVIKREGGGHVFFVVGHDAGHWLALGGNQSNRVSIMKVDKGRTAGLRWPRTYPIPAAGLPYSTLEAALSVNEA